MSHSGNAEISKLRMVSPEAEQEFAGRFERGQRASMLAREHVLDAGLAPFRVGSVPYLNAAPLTRGLESELVFATPADLGRMLERNELDAALLSVTEALLKDRYDILDGVAVASLGEVKSVLVAHRTPLARLRTIHCDTASLASVNLLRVLLAEQGLHPDLVPLESYEPGQIPDGSLLIGDPALRLLFDNPGFDLWDLGEAWHELTRLPFVYAVWALQRGLVNDGLRCKLREACDFGLDTLDSIIRDRPDFTLDFRKDYLGWHIHFHLGAEEKRGIARFVELLRKHNLGPVFDPRYVH